LPGRTFLKSDRTQWETHGTGVLETEGVRAFVRGKREKAMGSLIKIDEMIESRLGKSDEKRDIAL